MEGPLPEKHVWWEQATEGISRHSRRKRKKKLDVRNGRFDDVIWKNYPDEWRWNQPLTEETVSVWRNTKQRRCWHLSSCWSQWCRSRFRPSVQSYSNSHSQVFLGGFRHFKVDPRIQSWQWIWKSSFSRMLRPFKASSRTDGLFSAAPHFLFLVLIFFHLVCLVYQTVKSRWVITHCVTINHIVSLKALGFHSSGQVFCHDRVVHLQQNHCLKRVQILEFYVSEVMLWIRLDRRKSQDTTMCKNEGLKTTTDQHQNGFAALRVLLSLLHQTELMWSSANLRRCTNSRICVDMETWGHYFSSN